MMSDLLGFLGHLEISIYFAFATLIAFLVLYRRLDFDARLIAITMGCYFLIDFIAVVMSAYRINNLWFYNLMLIPQFILVSTLMIRKIRDRRMVLVFTLGCGTLVMLHLLNMAYLQGWRSFGSFTFIPACVWMAIIAFYYLREQMEVVDKPPFRSLLTWFALATLIDNSGTTPILSILGWPAFAESEYAYHLWNFIIGLYIVWYLIILTGLICTKTSLRLALYSR